MLEISAYSQIPHTQKIPLNSEMFSTKLNRQLQDPRLNRSVRKQFNWNVKHDIYGKRTAHRSSWAQLLSSLPPPRIPPSKTTSISYLVCYCTEMVRRSSRKKNWIAPIYWQMDGARSLQLSSIALGWSHHTWRRRLDLDGRLRHRRVLVEGIISHLVLPVAGRRLILQHFPHGGDAGTMLPFADFSSNPQIVTHLGRGG